MSEETPTYGEGRPIPRSVIRGDEDADRWKHRNADMRCRTCMWFVPKKVYSPAEDAHIDGDLGRCRRHAPTMGGFPAVFTSDFCGDHKLDENKVT